jgi:hypothetical protein
MAPAIARRYPAAMETHTFEVKGTDDGHYAVFVDGVRITDHASMADALAHCERLRRQAQV